MDVESSKIRMVMARDRTLFEVGLGHLLESEAAPVNIRR